MGPSLMRAVRRGLAVAGMWGTGSCPAHGQVGEPARYAVVIGANHGYAHEAALSYAERDSRRIADVLTSFGGVASENVVLLRGATGDELVRALSKVRRRIETEGGSLAAEATFFFYYSGHADGDGLHLGSDAVAFGELERLIHTIPAKARVVVIDACHSGDMTRAKGGAPTAPFDVLAETKLAGEGMAIITSSASGEDSQESDQLAGGIFTHHFAMGLQGAADSSHDGRVTLTEVYRYAYQQTVRATSRVAAVQHPSYAFDLRGYDDFVLTWLRDVRSAGTLRLRDRGEYLVFEDGARSRLVAEISVEDDAKLALGQGVYLVRRRARDEVRERRVEVVRGRVTALGVDEMRAVPYGTTVRRGYDASRRYAGAVSAESGVAMSLANPGRLGVVTALGVRVDLRRFSFAARLRHGFERADNRDVEIEQHLLGGDVGLLKVFDVGRWTPAAGIRVGGDWVRQTFTSGGNAPARSSAVWRGGPMLQLGMAVSRRVSLLVGGGADLYLLPEYHSATEETRLAARFLPYGTLGLAIQAF
ncbi:MAG: caspase family protein [Myxococcales bacterium FL481]|nr:MAG: caspase family protein [Myxococcales bacterium FL481]